MSQQVEIDLYTAFVTWMVDNHALRDNSEILQQELTLQVRDPSKNGERPFLEDVLASFIAQMTPADHL